MTFAIVKIFFLSTLAFIIAVSATPILTHFLYKYKLGKSIRSSGKTPLFTKMHEKKAGTPTLGGILVWGTLLVVISTFYLLSFLDIEILQDLNFMNRAQTLLPLGALLVAAIVGLIDDIIDIKNPKGGGLRMRHRMLLYALVAGLGAWWFYFKLDWDVLHIPFYGDLAIGWWYIPFFLIVIIATSFSVNETDGLDGLAGGSLLAGFTSYGIIAFAMGRYDLATFCGVIAGALLAFLWFNIYPARFFMGDTGSMSLGVTLGIIALLTNQALLLPIIGFIFVLESVSVIIQITSKKLFKKKVFLSAPIHHHFEASNWPEPKIVMRFWVISAVMMVIGLTLFLLDTQTL